MDTKHIKIKDFDYDLPDERIAKFPLAKRDDSKLLVYRKGKIESTQFFHLSEYIDKDDLMVFNNTKVIRARMRFVKDTGAHIEVFCLEPYKPHEYTLSFASRGNCQWLCMIGNLKKWKEGTLQLPCHVNGKDITLTATKCHTLGTSHIVQFSWDDPSLSFASVLEAAGELPIPPYLNRDTVAQDNITYQTVYSKVKGSVAAPTAGLHFTPEVLSDLDRHYIDREELTLHVGAGTFRPVKSEEIADHDMHTEYIAVHRHTIEALLRHPGHVVAVGTTSVRTLESLYYIGKILKLDPNATEDALHVPQWMPYDNDSSLSTHEALQTVLDYLDRNHLESLHTSTQIIIAPGYEYKVVNKMITNFHQPQSTLLLLVSAFVHGDWRTIYDYALAHDYRFLSYGDSSLLIP